MSQLQVRVKAIRDGGCAVGALLLGFLLVIIGSTGTWGLASTPFRQSPVSVAGLSVDGKWTAGIACFGVLMLIVRPSAVAMAGLLAAWITGIAVTDFASVSTAQLQVLGVSAPSDVGWGLYVVVAGGFISVMAAIVGVSVRRLRRRRSSTEALQL